MLTCPSRTGYGMSSLNDYGMATGRELLGSAVTLFSNWSFALHTDQCAGSMVDCGTEGEGVLSSSRSPLPQHPSTPRIGWKHIMVQVVLRNPKWQLPFWLKAKALTLERSALRLLLIQPASSFHARRGRPIATRFALADIDRLDSLVAFDPQSVSPSPQEEDLGRSWELPETGEI